VLPLYASMAWTRATLPLPLLIIIRKSHARVANAFLYTSYYYYYFGCEIFYKNEKDIHQKLEKFNVFLTVHHELTIHQSPT